MTKEQLIALRSAVSLAEHHIRCLRRSRNRLEWTKLIRLAHQASREVTHRVLDEAEKQGKSWKEL